MRDFLKQIQISLLNMLKLLKITGLSRFFSDFCSILQVFFSKFSKLQVF